MGTALSPKVCTIRPPPSPMPNSSILLCTMGLNWQVVPEAFLYRPEQFDEVHCLTTSSERMNPAPVIDFFRRFPEVHFTLSQLLDFTDLQTNEDHQRFEEVLFRWYLRHLRRAETLPFVCLAGGYKSISAALQKAAGLFGAAEIFHVLVEPPPQTLEEIEQAASTDNLKFISLGVEPGWSRLQNLNPEDFPLEYQSVAGGPLISVNVRNRDLGEHIRTNLSLISRRAEAWDRAADLPFPSLALCERWTAAWLSAPLDERTDTDWIRLLPKVELHCHFGGFATRGTLLEEVRGAATHPALAWPEPPALPKDWPLPQEPIPLPQYMKLGDATGSRLLKDHGCLSQHVELLYQHLLDDRVIYAEIRCSPNNYNTEDRSAWQVLEQIRNTFQRCMDEAKASGNWCCHVNLIVIATRKQSGDLSDISRHLALAITSAQHTSESGCCRVVGVDLAGYEAAETRAAYFASEFTGAHRCGIAITAHAGENDDAEGIWQAVFKLHARRLGHALGLQEAPDLERTVIERRIGVEMCPFANCQIKGFAPMPNRRNYPLLDYLHKGVLVTVNTDNIGISGASLSENLLLLPRLCPGITRLEILRLQANALEAAFMSHTERQETRRKVEALLVNGPAGLFANKAIA
jgi:adenosine deaminase